MAANAFTLHTGNSRWQSSVLEGRQGHQVSALHGQARKHSPGRVRCRRSGLTILRWRPHCVPGPRQAQSASSPRRTRHAPPGGQHEPEASGKAGGRGGLCRTAWAGDTGGQGTGSWQSPGRPGEDTGRERRGRKPAPPLAWAQFRQLWVGGCGGIQRPPARGASRRHCGSRSPALWGRGPRPPCFHERVPFTPCLTCRWEGRPQHCAPLFPF